MSCSVAFAKPVTIDENIGFQGLVEALAISAPNLTWCIKNNKEVSILDKIPKTWLHAELKLGKIPSHRYTYSGDNYLVYNAPRGAKPTLTSNVELEARGVGRSTPIPSYKINIHDRGKGIEVKLVEVKTYVKEYARELKVLG